MVYRQVQHVPHSDHRRGEDIPAATSSFVIGSMASKTRSRAASSASVPSQSSYCFGTTCQLMPKRSFSQPHCPGSPPRESSLQW